MSRQNVAVLLCMALFLGMLNGEPVADEGQRRIVSLRHGMAGTKLLAFRKAFLDRFSSTAGPHRIVDTSVGSVAGALRQNLIAGDDLPDLAIVNREDIPYLADAGCLYSLDELPGCEPADLDIDATLVRWLTYRDKLWGVPICGNTRVLFCNPQLMQEAGLPGPPVTWDQLTEFADQATRDTGSDGEPDLWGLHLGDSSATLRDFFFQANGDLDLSPSAPEPVTAAAFADAVSFMDELRFDRQLLRGEHHAEPLRDGFERGIVAMEIDRIERARSITMSGVPFIVAPLPAGKSSATGFTRDSVLVACRRPHGEPQGAAAFVKFFLSPEPHTEWARFWGYIPPSPAIRASQPYRDLAAERPWVDAAASTIESARFVALQPGSELVESALRRETSRVHERLAASVEEGLAALRRTVDAVATQGSARTDSEPELEVAFLPPAVKLRPGQMWRRYAAPTISVDMARNETESFQLVITARHGPVDVTDISIEAPGTRSDGRLSPYEIDLFEQIDIDIEEPMAGAEPGLYPDVLVPLAGAKTVRPETMLRVWLRVRVGEAALPGTYHSAVIVTISDGRVLRLPWSLRVHSVCIPIRSRLPATVGLNYGRLADRFGLTRGTDEWLQVADRYYEFLLDHRLTPFRPPVTAGDPESRPYLEDPRVSAFVFPHGRNEEKMSRTAGTLQAWGLRDKAFFYVEDEPFHAMYARIIDSGLKARRAAPGFSYMVTEPPTPDLDGLVDIWCIHVGFRPISTPSAVDEIESVVWKTEQARARGERIWWYTAGGVAPLPTLHIEDDGVAPRVMPWIQALYGVTGFLHWEAANWANDDVYADPYVPPFGNGEGVLIYPPRDNESTEPVPSIRLELLRDGLEDGELLDILRRSIDAVRDQIPVRDWDYTGLERIREYATAFIRDRARETAAYRWTFLLTEIDRDPGRFAPMRRKLMAEIDDLTAPPLALIRTRPPEGTYTTGTTATIEIGTEPGVHVSVNGTPYSPPPTGILRVTVPLQPGANPIRIDIGRNRYSKTIFRTLYRTGYDIIGSGE